MTETLSGGAERGAILSAAERELVARALGLYERFDLYRARPACFRPCAETPERLRRWRALSAANDEALFARRLRFDGFDSESVLPVLGEIVLPADTPLPSWIRTLRACVPVLAADLPPRGLPPLRLRRPLGEMVFQHYFEAWVRSATRAVSGRPGQLWDDPPDEVRAAFQLTLLDDLSQAVRNPLVEEFDRFRYGRVTTNALAEGALTTEPPRELYTAFVRDRLEDGAWPFLQAYPVFARLIATRIELWIERTSEVLARLQADAALLGARRAARGTQDRPGRLQRVRLDLSDAHDGGGRVLLAELAGGVRAVYKPRSVAPELWWNDLLHYLQRQDRARPGLRTLRVVDRGHYGWMEVADARPAQNAGEAHGRFESCGALLALAYVFRTTDCHIDNVIAAGPSMVLVDAETLLEPEPQALTRAAQASGRVADLRQRLETSVLRTGLLPLGSGDGTAPDISGLLGRTVEVRAPQWLRINTDVMLLGATDQPTNTSLEPTTDGDDHAEDVLRGFERVYRLFLGGGRRRFARSSLAAALRRLRVRFVVRPSSTYSGLLSRARSADNLADGLSLSLALDRLARPLLGADEPPALWPVLREEHRALQRGDLPLFSARANGCTLLVQDAARGRMRRVGGRALTRSGWSRFHERLASLSAEDLSFQKRCVELSLAIATRRRAEGAAGGPRSGTTATAAFDAERALDAARRIARDLAESAFADARGGRDWIGLVADPHQRGAWVSALPPTLYEGAPGIAVFLAAVADLDHDPRLGEVARAALAPVSRLVRSDPRAVVEGMGLGGLSGVGGLIWALATSSRLLGEAALLRDARRLAGAIEPETIEGHPHLDLVSGVAGLTLALAAVADERGLELAARLIEACGRRLVESAVAWQGGLGWSDPDACQPLCGLSHGSSGIALALMAAWARVADPTFLVAARSALDAERTLRDERHANWPDLRGSEPRWMSTWCHGAPGIALARAAILALDEPAGARADLGLALRGLRLAELDGGHLCCGTAGLDDVLLEVGRLTGETALIEEARARTAGRVAAAEDSGGWRASPERHPSAQPPGLMTGLAGIGYGLLRAVRPEAYPSVLLLGTHGHAPARGTTAGA